MLLSGDDSGLKMYGKSIVFKYRGEESLYSYLWNIVADSIKEIYTKYPVPVKQAINYMGSIDQSEETEDSYNNDFSEFKKHWKKLIALLEILRTNA